MSIFYRTLLFGSAASAFGSWLDFLAILTLASHIYQVSPYGMAMVGAVGLLPGIIFAKMLGNICDGSHTVRVVKISLIVRIAATLGICFYPNFFWFVVLVALRSAATSATPLAINVLAARMLPTPFMRKFYAQQSVLANIAKVLSPSVGALLAGLYGEIGSLALAALLCMLSLIFSLRLPALLYRSQKKSSSKISNQLFSPVAADRCGELLLMIAIYFACVFLVNNQLPLILIHAGFDAYYFGVLVSCSGLGNVLGGILSTFTKGQALQHHSRQLLVPAAFQAVGIFAFGLVLHAAQFSEILLPLIFFLLGIVSAQFAIVTGWVIAERYASSVGQTSALVQKWQNIMMLCAPLVGAVMFDKTGASTLLMTAGSCGLIALLLAYAYSARAARQSIMR